MQLNQPELLQIENSFLTVKMEKENHVSLCLTANNVQ